MFFNLNTLDWQSSYAGVRIDRHPDTCPVCHTSTDATQLSHYVSGTIPPYTSLEILCRCTKSNCHKIFLAQYEPIDLSSGIQHFYYRRAVPYKYVASAINDTIKEISSSFYTIYAQAEHAETLGLKEICGAGYRKALEFLVKDYILSAKSGIKANSEEVKKTLLGKCIEKYIDDNNTKKLARLASWLGNDETHYYRKWEDKDLTDLKQLIHLTLNAIDSHLVGNEYIEDMTPKTGTG